MQIRRDLSSLLLGFVVVFGCSDADPTSPQPSTDGMHSPSEVERNSGFTPPEPAQPPGVASYDCQFFLRRSDEATQPQAGVTIQSDQCYWIDSFSNSELDDHFATGSDDTPTPGLPTWSGESFGSLGTDQMRFCPVAVSRPHFTLNIPGHGIVHFRIPGVVTITYENPVIKEATYALPAGNHWDSTGRYRIVGGTITGACFVWEFNLPFRRVVGGWMSWYPNYTGLLFYHDQGINPTGGSAGGWAYKDADVYIENGAGDGWEDALHTYVSGGGCTSGWEIWVNSTQRCDRYGNLL